MFPKQKRPKVVRESSRASKRQRKREDPPTSEPIDQPPPFSSTRFISQNAEQNYKEGYAKRPILCERGIMLEQFEGPSCDLLQLIMAKGWQSWVRFQHKAIIPLVKEFYANMSSSKDNSGNKCLISEVRKVKIELRPSNIADIFQIPRKVAHRDPKDSSVDLGKENMARILTGKNDVIWLGHTLPKKSLSPRCIILHRLLYSHFMPHAFTGTVSMKQSNFYG